MKRTSTTFAAMFSMAMFGAPALMMTGCEPEDWEPTQEMEQEPAPQDQPAAPPAEPQDQQEPMTPEQPDQDFDQQDDLGQQDQQDLGQQDDLGEPGQDGLDDTEDDQAF